MAQREKRKLGSWFPSATVIKNASYENEEPNSITLMLFYHYVQPRWSEKRQTAAIAYVEDCASKLNLGGRCRVSQEGVNCTISGTFDGTRKFAEELKGFDEDFKRTDFKYVDSMPLDRAFKDLKVLPVRELVFYGIDNEHTLGKGGVHLEPKEYHQKLAEAKDDTVVIDVRNGYEYDIGRFDGQQLEGGAELLNPEMRKSTDFPAWVNKEETRKKLEGKNVLMYCTGGVRCERASALLQREYGDSLKGVYQLQGGVEKYMQEFPDGGFWRGKNFVFDKREAFDVQDPAGVGGVIKKSTKANVDDLIDGSKKKQKKEKKESQKKGKKGAVEEGETEEKEEKDNVSPRTANKETIKNLAQELGLVNKKEKEGKKGPSTKIDVLSVCCVCNARWDRYIGKKKCKTCEVPVLMCESCCTKRVDKDKSMFLKMRCPLCVKEKCTVPAEQVGMTDNGRKSDYRPNDTTNVRQFTDHEAAGAGGSAHQGGIVASTVCKWGGGNGKKKERRTVGQKANTSKKLSSIACRLGAACQRNDCWFSHPGK